MKIQRSFQAPVSNAVALQRASAFLIKAGYKRQPRVSNGLLFRRGSLFGTLTSFDPTHWSCDVKVSTEPRGDSCSVEVIGNIATDPSEKRFAAGLVSAEFDSLEAAVSNAEVAAFDVGALKRRIASHVYRVVGVFASLIVPAVLAVLAFALTVDRFSATAAWGVALATFLIAAAGCLLLWHRLTRGKTI